MNKRYRLVILDLGSTAVETGIQLVLATDDIKLVEGAAAAAQSFTAKSEHAESALVEMNLLKSGPGAKGRKVTIRTVEEDSPFRHLQPGDHFDNAKRLSEIFGSKHNPVSVALKRAELDNETEVTMHGVTFCYTDTIKAD